MNLVELLKRLKELRVRGEELRAISSKDFTEDLLSELETNNKDRDFLTRKIDAIQAGGDLDENEDRTSNGPIPGQGGGFEVPDQETRGGPCINKSYRGMFFGGDNQYQISRDGFENQGEFLEVLRSGRFDDRLQRASMGESVESSGGYSVPTSFAESWLNSSLELEIVRPRAQVWAMDSPTRLTPAWDGADHTDGTTFGGLKLEWLQEKGTGTRQVAKLRLIELKAKKAAIFCQISSELEADGMDFAAQLQGALTSSLSFGLDDCFLFGSGAGQPMGCLCDENPSLITVPKESGQASGSIVFENLTKIFSRMAPSSLGNAVWLANSSAIPQLLTLNLAIGTGGAHIPVLREESGRFFIFGKEVLFTEKMKALGSQGDICLIDFSQYSIGLRKELAIDRSVAPGWTEDMVDYRIITRLDAQPTWDKPVTPLNGDTVSPFVTLAERS